MTPVAYLIVSTLETEQVEARDARGQWVRAGPHHRAKGASTAVLGPAEAVSALDIAREAVTAARLGGAEVLAVEVVLDEERALWLGGWPCSWIWRRGREKFR